MHAGNRIRCLRLVYIMLFNILDFLPFAEMAFAEKALTGHVFNGCSVVSYTNGIFLQHLNSFECIGIE